MGVTRCLWTIHLPTKQVLAMYTKRVLAMYQDYTSTGSFQAM